jgi:hypothetical protein
MRIPVLYFVQYAPVDTKKCTLRLRSREFLSCKLTLKEGGTNTRVNNLMRLCLIFVRNCCRINIVFDGTKRHHSKRSTIKRTVDCYRNKVDYHVAKCLLSTLNERYKTAITDINKAQQTEEINKVRKEMKVLERKMSETLVDVGEKLVNAVKEEILKIKKTIMKI